MKKSKILVSLILLFLLSTFGITIEAADNIENSDMVFTKPVYTVTFEYNNGQSETMEYTGSGNIELPTPEMKGYQFNGWYYDNGTFEEEFTIENISSDCTVYAKWTRMWKINFETFGGTSIEPIYALSDIDVTYIPSPVRLGFSFDGWYWDREFTVPFVGTGIEEYMSNTDVKEVTVYAKYDNTLFLQDFEDEYNEIFNEAYMREMSPDKWEELIASGAGVVTDNQGNRSFRIPAGGTFSCFFPGGGAGAGLYEISYRVKSDDANFIFHPANPMTGGKKWDSFYISDGRFVFEKNSSAKISVWNSSNGVSGWAYVTMRYDTQNGVASCYVEWTDIYGHHMSSQLENLTIDITADGINGISVGNASGDGVTNIYVDDYVVKKIMQPMVMNIFPIGENVECDSEIEIEFDRLMDRTTINEQTIYLLDYNGNKVDAKVSAVNGIYTTVAKLVPERQLEYNAQYSINVTKMVRDVDGYYLDRSYSSTFSTVAGNIFNTKSDSGYYGEKGIPESGDIVFNVSLSGWEDIKDRITDFGMFVYVTENRKVELSNGILSELMANNGKFFAKVTNIAQEFFNTPVYAKPYIITDTGILYGSAVSGKVNDKKWLGRK